MLLENNKDKGRAGISLAIAYFGSNGYTVCIPLNDTQNYDLVVEKNDILYRVSVKFTGYKPNINYQVDLRSCGGYSGARTYGNFLESGVELLFIATEVGTLYLIPKEKIRTKVMVALNDYYEKFIVYI